MTDHRRSTCGALGLLGADRHPHHPAAVERGRRQVGRAGAVDAITPRLRVRVQVFAATARAARAARRPSAAAPAPARASPAWRRPARPATARSRGRAAARACRPLTPCSRIRNHSFSARKRRPERDAPVAVVLHAAVGRRLQVARVGGHHAHEVLGVAHVVDRAVERRAQPLVRVEHERVGRLDAVPHPAALGQDHRRAGHRGIDVQPQPVPATHVAQSRCTGSSAVVVVVPVVATTAHGHAAGGAVLGDGRRQRVGAHRVVRVARRRADVLAAEAGQQRRLVHGAVAVGGGVDDQRLRLGLQPAARERVAGGPFARADQREQRRGRRRVLDHALPRVRQAHHLAQPVGGDLFHFGQRRTRLPGQAEHAEAGATRSRRARSPSVPLHGK